MLVSLTFNEEWAAANPELAKNFVTAFSEAQEYIKTHEDVWPELANDVDITDPDAVELLRERVGPKLLNIWDEEFIEQQIQFHEQVIESIGSSEEVPSEIPEGSFTTEFAT